MKRPKKGTVITIGEPVVHLRFEIPCPHCHTKFIYFSQMEFKNVLMYSCSQCHNPIDLRKP